MRVNTGKGRITVDDSEKVKNLESKVQSLEQQVADLKKKQKPPQPEDKSHA